MRPGLRAGAVLPVGSWQGPAADRVLIDFDRRHRRRLLLATEGGAELLLDLPQAVRLRDGDGLRLEDGRIIEVAARPEPLLEIVAPDPQALVRIAWHLGNRHLPVQMLGLCLRIRADHVIAEMVRGLGGAVRPLDAPFDPEPGAYAAGHHSHHEAEDEAVHAGHDGDH